MNIKSIDKLYSAWFLLRSVDQPGDGLRDLPEDCESPCVCLIYRVNTTSLFTAILNNSGKLVTRRQPFGGEWLTCLVLWRDLYIGVSGLSEYIVCALDFYMYKLNLFDILYEPVHSQGGSAMPRPWAGRGRASTTLCPRAKD